MAKKVCSKCSKLLDLEQFSSFVDYRNGNKCRMSQCQSCTNRERRTRKHQQGINKPRPSPTVYTKLREGKHLLRSTHGLQEYRESRGDVCEICGQPETAKRQGVVRQLSIDHCHSTGILRGVLCHRCNTGIGYLGHDIEKLKNAIKYLEAAKSLVKR